MRAILNYLDRRDTPAWIRVFLRRILAQLIVGAALLSGCAPFDRSQPTPAASASWEQIAPGLERRFYRPNGNYPLTQFLILRIDPSVYTFRVHYRPGDPLTLAGWRGVLPGAVAFVNANYFDPQDNALGLVVADGVAYGQAYQGLGGMLQVQGSQASTGSVRVRSTILEPYTGEPLEQAVQAFPMLITDGQASFSNTQGDRPSRRTVVGQDQQGRILLIATPSLVGMKLVDLSSYLATTDLDLANAVNLDGGGSTMLALDAPGQPSYQILSLDPVPTVLAVYPR